MTPRTFNGFRSIQEIARWKRQGFVPAVRVRDLVRAFTKSNLLPAFVGTGNRARRRQVALELAREWPKQARR